MVYLNFDVLLLRLTTVISFYNYFISIITKKHSIRRFISVENQDLRIRTIHVSFYHI